MLSQERINEYISNHKLSWADTSQKTEKYRLQALLPYTQVMEDCSNFYERLVADGYKPYSIKTIFIRLADFCDHFGLSNPYRSFLNSHARLFKHAYSPEVVHISYDEAMERVQQIDRPEIRQAAISMLTSGLRTCELGSISKGLIKGKGQKERPFLSDYIPAKVSRSSLWRELRKVGLKPHTLRKLFATRLLEKGLDIKNVCHVLGWKNLNTAQSYLQPKKDSELKKFISEAVRANL